MAEALHPPLFQTDGHNRKERIITLLRGGILDQKSGALDRAIQRFSKALAMAPDHPAGYIFRGAAWEKKGELRRAIADYNVAIRLDLSCAQGYYRRGLAWKKLGLRSRSDMDFQKAADLNAKYDRRPPSDAEGAA